MKDPDVGQSCLKRLGAEGDGFDGLWPDAGVPVPIPAAL